MIDYEYSVYNCAFLLRYRGSVFPFACLVAFPCTLAAALLKSFTLHDPDFNMSDWQLLADGSSGAWSGFNFLVGFVIVFRTSQAYTRFWSALGDTHQMMAAWFEAASSVVAFSRSSPADMLVVENWLHTVIRLFSLLSASALQELTDVAYHHTWGLPTLDASAIDPQSISTLDASSCRVELLYHWIQQFISDGAQLGVLTTPAPLLNRTLAELAKGMDKYQDAMKHSKIPFPFPYAQTTLVLLIFHWILTPLVMAQWTTTVFGSAVFTFVQVFTLWCLNATAVGFERPFGGEANDIDHIDLQMMMNKSLINLMEPRSRRLPFIPATTYLDIEVLRKRDTIHAAALQQEGWELKDIDWNAGIAGMAGAFQACCRSCSKRRRPTAGRSLIAVSTRYSSKRYCEIDGEKTAVLTVGIVGSELFLALPALPNDTRNTFEVLNVAGRPCTLRAKRIPIQQRHLLTKGPDPAWNDDYRDFPPEYNFAAEALARAYEKQKGSRAEVGRHSQGEEAKVMRGVSQHLQGGPGEAAPEADDKGPVLPGAVQDLKDPMPEAPSGSSERKVAPLPAGGTGVATQPDAPSSEKPSEEHLSARKEGPRDVVLPWMREADEGKKPEEPKPPEGGQVLPWGAQITGKEVESAPAEDAKCDLEAGAQDPEQVMQDGREVTAAVSFPKGVEQTEHTPLVVEKEALQHADTSGLILAAESALATQGQA